MAHASDFSIIYAIPTDGLNPWEVARALGGVNSEDIGTLCTHSNVNMWAKRKPVRLQTMSPVTDLQREAINWGFSIPYSTFLTYFDEPRFWEYQKPRGASQNEWYRLLDFDGYVHGASAMASQLNVPTPRIFKGRSTDVQVYFSNADELPMYEFKVPQTISSTEKKRLSSFFICFLMQMGDDIYIYCTGQTPTSGGQALTASIPSSMPDGYFDNTAVKIAAVLCAYDNLPLRSWTLIRPDFLWASYSFVPMSLSPAMLADWRGIVKTYAHFEDARMTVDVRHRPVYGENYYTFDIKMLCVLVNIGPADSPYPFALTMRLVRGGATIDSLLIDTQQITASYDEETSMYVYSFDEIDAAPFASQSEGDSLYIDLRYDGDVPAEITSVFVETI